MIYIYKHVSEKNTVCIERISMNKEEIIGYSEKTDFKKTDLFYLIK
jgi:hypothetical protein